MNPRFKKHKYASRTLSPKQWQSLRYRTLQLAMDLVQSGIAHGIQLCWQSRGSGWCLSGSD